MWLFCGCLSTKCIYLCTDRTHVIRPTLRDRMFLMAAYRFHLNYRSIDYCFPFQPLVPSIQARMRMVSEYRASLNAPAVLINSSSLQEATMPRRRQPNRRRPRDADVPNPRPIARRRHFRWPDRHYPANDPRSIFDQNDQAMLDVLWFVRREGGSQLIDRDHDDLGADLGETFNVTACSLIQSSTGLLPVLVSIIDSYQPRLTLYEVASYYLGLE